MSAVQTWRAGHALSEEVKLDAFWKRVMWERARAVRRHREHLQYEAMLVDQGVDMRDMRALYHLAKLHGLSDAYSTTDAFIDREAESYVHELSHAFCEGILLFAPDEADTVEEAEATSTAVARRIKRKAHPAQDDSELWASAVEEEVFQKLGWYLEVEAYRDGTRMALTADFTRADMELAMVRLRRTSAVKRLAHDIVRYIRSARY